MNCETGGYVYLLASTMAGTLYVGATSNLLKRIHEHREGLMKGFTSQYHVYRLVYFEQYGTITDAIAREKRIKGWKRAWKIRLIEKSNPKWDDLYPEIVRWEKA